MMQIKSPTSSLEVPIKFDNNNQSMVEKTPGDNKNNQQIQKQLTQGTSN